MMMTMMMRTTCENTYDENTYENTYDDENHL